MRHVSGDDPNPSLLEPFLQTPSPVFPTDKTVWEETEVRYSDEPETEIPRRGDSERKVLEGDESGTTEHKVKLLRQLREGLLMSLEFDFKDVLGPSIVSIRFV